MGKLRELRKNVLEALEDDDWPSGLAALEVFAPKDLLGPLFACLLDRDKLVRWRAVTAFGVVVARLFAAKPEDARQLVRQLMWRLNEESGNVAWGTPESFGEILARQPALAAEFHKVLASYINERECKTGDNFIELCPLRRGAYWGLARLAQDRPEMVLCAFDDLALALTSDDPESRAFAAWAMKPLLPLAGEKASGVRACLQVLSGDKTPMALYRDGRLSETTVAALAAEAIAK
jgi:hypothetical protein